ncbi:hypothetical protein HC752_15260 [Vibrio sp. S9_S30]|uniref:hypothetical protein n=1 Tax=Vibrio sp. S9_S30 TaxID=2720226 RepID=UPI0016809CCF|nr:hypothetical protein [Vibrio sp. S9_S30]MBD1558295.1 hypothetical protein [Vibrio sp. S9_S30]
MKKSLTALVLVFALVGCEDATNAIDQAQKAANSAVDNFQEQWKVVDFADLNLEQFGNAAESAQALTSAVEQIMNMDFNNSEALAQATEHISNAYSCLVEASSELTADKLIERVMGSIANQDVLILIQEGVEQAKVAQECVI